ncbi:hypothetical protein M1N79_05100 [Dehalococcoidia bacterium]|nr:hypothetical protein [Dehalococcoidia bacterium]
MKIEFTREEYKRLLDTLYIADWVLNAHKVKDDPRTEAYGKLEQKIYSYAKDMELEDLIEYAADHEEYYPTREYEETGPPMEFIGEFENETFWEELISRLADRDLIRQVGGVENLSKLSFEERIEKTLPLEEKYSSEFEERGLDRVSIVCNSE